MSSVISIYLRKDLLFSKAYKLRKTILNLILFNRKVASIKEELIIILSLKINPLSLSYNLLYFRGSKYLIILGVISIKVS